MKSSWKDLGNGGGPVSQGLSEADLRVAAWNLLSHARDAEDFLFLMECLGIDRDVLFSLKDGVS